MKSVLWGILLCIIFTVASPYSEIKVGRVMESAIPISILTIGLTRAYRRRSTILENVIVIAIGGEAGSLVAGAIFTLPALYILKLDAHTVQTTFICLVGGCLGVLFLIPLRRHFVRDMHGLLPYPEATAITEVLVTGEKGGSQAKLLLATGIAAAMTFSSSPSRCGKSRSIFSSFLSEQARIVFRFDAIGFILGLGYVMGLRSSMIFCAGGILPNFVLGADDLVHRYPARQHGLSVVEATDTSSRTSVIPISNMSAGQIFRDYVRFVGVGAIAAAGILGIAKSLRIAAGAIGIALRVCRKSDVVTSPERVDRDISTTACKWLP